MNIAPKIEPQIPPHCICGGVVHLKKKESIAYHSGEGHGLVTAEFIEAEAVYQIKSHALRILVSDVLRMLTAPGSYTVDARTGLLTQIVRADDDRLAAMSRVKDERDRIAKGDHRGK